jgi:hypothetical protein
MFRAEDSFTSRRLQPFGDGGTPQLVGAAVSRYRRLVTAPGRSYRLLTARSLADKAVLPDRYHRLVTGSVVIGPSKLNHAPVPDNSVT